MTLLSFKLQRSGSVRPNRNDKPDQMAATRASARRSGIKPKYISYNKKKRGSGGRQPLGRVIHPSLSKLQNVLLLLAPVGTFITSISGSVILINCPQSLNFNFSKISAHVTGGQRNKEISE